MEKNKNFLSTTQLAKLLGISRVAVFKNIKKGKITAKKLGRNFVINAKEIREVQGNSLTNKQKKELNLAIDKTVREYGETLRLLGRD